MSQKILIILAFLCVAGGGDFGPAQEPEQDVAPNQSVIVQVEKDDSNVLVAVLGAVGVVLAAAISSYPLWRRKPKEDE